MAGITIIGTGSYVPGEPYRNEALSRVMDTTDEWIRKRTGIEQRHYAPDGVGASDLAVHASRQAIASADLDPEDIDYIVFATMTPDYVFPGSGGLLGAKLGIPGVPALDIRQQCAAIPFGLQIANGLAVSGAARTILLVGAEAHAGFMPWQDWDQLSRNGRQPSAEDIERHNRHRGFAILFGDGAGALVLRQAKDERSGFIGALVHSDGNLADQIYIRGGGFRRRPYWTADMHSREEHIPQMQGRELFKHAVTKLPKVVNNLCRQHTIALDDIDWFIAHQANQRINETVRQALKVPPEKVPSNIERYGNTSGATIPILLDELWRDGKLKEGQLICFLALGSGLHWGAAIMRL